MEPADSSLCSLFLSMESVLRSSFRRSGLFPGHHLPFGMFSWHHFELLNSNEAPGTNTNWKSPRGGMNRPNLKFINFEHTLHSRLGLEINNIEFEEWEIVLLALSCSINADNFGIKLKSMWARELLGREEREETNRVIKINTSEHGDLFPEVRFQGTYSPLRRPKGWVYSNPFPLSIGHLDRLSASS